MLAITACDDGAVVDVSAERDPDDPSMIRIKTLTRTTALESNEWAGFGSSQL